MTRNITLIILFLFALALYPAATSKQYGNWKVKTIVYDGTDKKTVTMSLNLDKKLEVYIASRQEQLNITITWYKDKINNDDAVISYYFDNKQTTEIEPIVRSEKNNFDILYTISPSFGIVQEDEIINFFKDLINHNTMTIKPYRESKSIYNINLKGIKEAIEYTDFSNTLFDKYKPSILKCTGAKHIAVRNSLIS